MFEKFNENSRRALFFSRYEASKLGSRLIESEHILLGILREGEESVVEIFRCFKVEPADIRREIEGDQVFSERISSTVEVPLSEDSKKILLHASREGESSPQAIVGSEHLLIGLLRVEGCTAQHILAKHGFDVNKVRKEIVSLQKKTHPEARQARRKWPRIFISHRHRDEPVAAALVAALQAAFRIDEDDIRCTSVQPFRLPVGRRTSDQLRSEIQNAEAVIGIVTPDAKESSYVLFELGAAWGHGILTCPLLACGATIGDIPDPIRDLNTLSLADEVDCHQLLDDLSESTTLARREKVSGVIQQRIRSLVGIASISRPKEGM